MTVSHNNSSWKAAAPRWFLLAMIAALGGALVIGSRVVWSSERIFRQKLQDNLEAVPAIERRVEAVERQTQELRTLVERTESRIYEQHGDLLRFYIYYADEHGDSKTAKLFRERLKEIQSYPPRNAR